MTDPNLSGYQRINVDRAALDYVLRYIRQYDRLPSDEAPHPFWDAFAVLHTSRTDPPFDREPHPSDGPDYHADHAAWQARQSDEPGEGDRG